MSTPAEGPDTAEPSTVGDPRQPLSPGKYVIISACGLLLSVGLLLFLVFGADRILAAGLDHRVFYVVLVPLGLSAAAFAFGAMNSSGTFTSRGSREVRLAGPAMFAALVVVGGFFLVPDSGLMTLAVRVDRPIDAGGDPIAGAIVTVDWGMQRITHTTDGTGQVSFPGLPNASGVEIAVTADGYEPQRRVLQSAPAGGVVRVELVPRTPTTRVAGVVFDRAVGAPLEGVVLSFNSGTAMDTTDAAGNFAVVLPVRRGARVLVLGTRDGTRGLNTEIVVTDSVPVQLQFGN